MGIRQATAARPPWAKVRVNREKAEAAGFLGVLYISKNLSYDTTHIENHGTLTGIQIYQKMQLPASVSREVACSSVGKMLHEAPNSTPRTHIKVKHDSSLL